MSVALQAPIPKEQNYQKSLDNEGLKEEEKYVLNPLMMLCKILNEIKTLLRDHRFDEKKIAKIADRAYLQDTTEKANIYPQIVKLKEICACGILTVGMLSVVGNATSNPLGNFLSNRVSNILTPEVIKRVSDATGTYGRVVLEQGSQVASLQNQGKIAIKDYSINHHRQEFEASRANEKSLEQEVMRLKELLLFLLKIEAKNFGASSG